MTALHSATVGGLALEEAERIADVLQAFAASAALINETDEAAGVWEAVGYFGSVEAAEAALRLLDRPGRIAAVPEADWVRHSLEGLAPVAAGRFFLHGSHDRARRRAGGISLEIDAGTAFGTGHHATTQACLAALDDLLKRRRPRRVLDLGCGTGVLAIAAARALRATVIAGDIDAEAVRVARLNARCNGASVKVLVAAGLDRPELRRRACRDLVFANILARPLVALAPAIVAALAPGGMLILAGLTRDQERWVRAAYRNRGLVPAPAIRLGTWSALRFTQKKSARRSGRQSSGRKRS
jgi:ribosomal protein L11 methyltransferase